MVSQDDVVSGIPGSDHEAILFSVRCVKSKVVRHNHVSGGVTYNFKKADFSHCLSVISWNCCFLSGDVDDVLTNFKDLVFTTADQCKPDNVETQEVSPLFVCRDSKADKKRQYKAK